MRGRLVGLVGVVLIAAACGASPPAPEPAESLPPLPAAPPGWVSVGGMGGSGGAGSVGIAIALGGHKTALNAACSGNGTLVVLIGPASLAERAGIGPSAVFPCGSIGAVVVNRFEIANMPIPDQATVSAIVVEGLGTLRHASFNISVEQPQP